MTPSPAQRDERGMGGSPQTSRAEIPHALVAGFSARARLPSAPSHPNTLACVISMTKPSKRVAAGEEAAGAGTGVMEITHASGGECGGQNLPLRSHLMSAGEQAGWSVFQPRRQKFELLELRAAR
eukprot:CAMPEP_0174884780 /NCGR_PEP_ID=MMETSP0167-20121228/202_1 /TAXON_ID=38298 /ORGANISM="Rhodella maculata, Strain CCMP736" /LENGTH=124 /DNA_ID=CAMNT_0016120219 /DNA_START=522 /DNA_END=891 /DNA_ORIENTATION=-